MSNPVIELYSPLSGHTIELARVPDPVFSAKMAGDGIAIDPTSETLLAPCSGTVLNIHPSCHALTLRTDSGLEVLMHIGLDTVLLRGKGFTAKVKAGDKVKAKDPLIEFDAALIAEEAKSLITMVLISNTDAVKKLAAVSGFKTAGQDILLKVTADEISGAAVSEEDFDESESIIVGNPQGIHARPAAVMVSIAKKFTDTDIRIVRGSQSANCKSVVSIMSLQIKKGESVKFKAAGPSSQDSLKSLTEALKSGLGEDTSSAPTLIKQPAAAKETANASALHSSDTDKLYHGLIASCGLTFGYIHKMRRSEYEIQEKGQDSKTERILLEKAIGNAQNELKVLQNGLKSQADKAEIFAAHCEILDDPDLTDAAYAKISQGFSAAFAWKQAYSTQAEQLSKLSSELLAARAADIRDAGERVLRLLSGKVQTKTEYPENTILAAEDLTPSDTASLDRSKVLGFITVLGGTTSHAAILARSLDLPALAGMSPKILDIKEGTAVILDASKGTLELNPSDDRTAEVKEKITKQKLHRQELLSHASEQAVTSDGHIIEVAANIGSEQDAEEAVSMGCDGVGLLRSEFLFFGRSSAPSEEEQAEIYAKTARILGQEKTLVIRTLDVGGDKPLSYLPIPTEANPFLGERGIRVSLNHPEVLRTQFRAILKASSYAKIQIMLPMVTTIDEFRQAKAIFAEECRKLNKCVPLGIMIEVPAAALSSETLAKEAEFFSIGTNDLIQYASAIDRGHPKLGSMADGLSPAVLRLIKMTTYGAHKYDRKVSVCGGLAGDIQAAAILIGLGVDKLSVPAPVIPAIKDHIRSLSFEECRNLAQKALACENAQAVRRLQEGAEQ